MSVEVRPRLLAIGGLIAMAAAVGIGRFIYTPILPPMAEDLHLTKGEAGLIASANFLGYLAGAVMASSLRLLGGPRAWLLVALAVSAATTGTMAWPDGMSAFLALRFIGGVASAYALVLASSLVLERLSATPEEAINTAVAARLLSDSGDTKKAAVASEAAAVANGLTILCRNVQDNPDNATTFCIVARDAGDDGTPT